MDKSVPTETVSSIADSVIDIAVPPTTTTTAPTTPTQAINTLPTPTSLPIPKRRFNASIVLEQNEKRRASNRPIKRKRFDDEIVEYSPTIHQTRSGNSDIIRSRNRAVVQSLQSQIHQTPAVTAPIETTAVDVANTVDETVTASPAQSTMPVVTAASNNLATLDSLRSPQPVGRSPPIATQRKGTRTGNRRVRRHVGRQTINPPIKDLGRWKPIDDLALIIGVQQTNDLRMVHRGVKFSCKFTYPELQARWQSLLYEPSVSRLAVSAMRNLHPETIRSVQSKAPFSVQEEELLGTFRSTDSPKPEQFQELLNKNASIFYIARTAKSLSNHWQLMKYFHLLPDQEVKPSATNLQPLTFSDAEEQIIDSELQEPRNEDLDNELSLFANFHKRRIRQIENELPRLTALVESALDLNLPPPEFDEQTLAVLKGQHVRYLMRSKEITFGRKTKDSFVDVDLSFEGPATKISRTQGIIKLRSNGDFFVANEGKRPIFIDGFPLLQGSKTRLAHNCIVEIAGLRFRFLVNFELVRAIQVESAKINKPLN